MLLYCAWREEYILLINKQMEDYKKFFNKENKDAIADIGSEYLNEVVRKGSPSQLRHIEEVTILERENSRLKKKLKLFELGYKNKRYAFGAVCFFGIAGGWVGPVWGFRFFKYINLTP